MADLAAASWCSVQPLTGNSADLPEEQSWCFISHQIAKGQLLPPYDVMGDFLLLVVTFVLSIVSFQ